MILIDENAFLISYPEVPDARAVSQKGVTLTSAALAVQADARE